MPWINLDTLPNLPDLRQNHQKKFPSPTSASAMEEIIKQQKAEFPAGYAAAQRFRIANRDGNRNQTQNWGEFYLKNFPHHEHAKEISDLLSALNEDADVDPLAIGLLLPLSGKIKQIASQAMAGATVAMNVFSSSEQTAPHPIKLFVKDIGDGDPESTRNALKSLISEHHVIAVVGPLTSKATQSISQMAQDYHVPVISLSPSEDLTDSGNTIFRNGLTKKEQAIALAQLSAQLLNIKRAAILYPENKYGSEFKQLFWEEFEKYGGEIRGSESYNRDDTSFASPIRKLVGLEPKELRSGEICSPSQEKLYQQNKANPDLSASPSCYPYDELPPIIDFEAIFIPDSFDKARQILPALKYYDVRGVQVLGTNLWNTDGFLEGTTGQDLEGVIFMDSFFPMKKTAEVERFVEHFKADYDYAPSIHAAQTFDAIRALMWIMEKNSPRSRSAMISRLYQFKGYEGVTGLVGFGANREAIRNITPLMVQDKKVVELY
ncbi:MAG: penicillin-binding protein activator [Bdellovibrionota bacterium]